jgi:hypothetical protein
LPASVGSSFDSSWDHSVSAKVAADDADRGPAAEFVLAVGGVADVEIDRLRSDDRDGITVSPECFDGIECGSAGEAVEVRLRFASGAHWPASKRSTPWRSRRDDRDGYECAGDRQGSRDEVQSRGLRAILVRRARREGSYALSPNSLAMVTIGRNDRRG